MNEDIQRVRRIAKETALEILDEEVIGPITELINSFDAGIAAFKHQLSVAKGVKRWDHDKIEWKRAESASGPYERSEDTRNMEFKTMLKDLVDHGGKMVREGWFYWVFRNGSTVGRKKQKR